MNDEVKFAGIGAYLYGALYLAGVFVAGLAAGNHWAVMLAVTAAGLSYVAQMAVAMRVAVIPVYLVAIAASVASGVALLIGG